MSEYTGININHSAKFTFFHNYIIYFLSSNGHRLFNYKIRSWNREQPNKKKVKQHIRNLKVQKGLLFTSESIVCKLCDQHGTRSNLGVYENLWLFKRNQILRFKTLKS